MKILFVDDEPFYMSRHVNAVKAAFQNYTVDQKDNIDDAIEYVEVQSLPTTDEHDTGSDIIVAKVPLQAIILDIMMPKPSRYIKDIDGVKLKDNMNTGVWFLYYLRQDIRDRNIKVIVLTNNTRDFPAIQAQVRKLELPRASCYLKRECPPDVLVQKLREFGL